jgi:predicted methyltransferase
MPPEDLEAQATRVGPYLAGKRVFFLGDDDHLSPMFAKDHGVTPVVLEYDERIRQSLTQWFDRLAISESVVQDYDARNPVVVESLSDAFYINPPYSSWSKGLGIKVWLMRAIEACIPNCSGVLVMPRDGGNIDEPWVAEVEASVDKFINDNGFSIIKVDSNVTEYVDTTDAGLKSSNVYLERTNTKMVRTIDPGDLYN